MSDGPAMLVVEDLHKSFGDLEAVSGISFSVSEGELFSLLGPNGAGKTTTIKMVVNLLRPTAGSIRIGGHNLSASSLEARRLLGYIPDRPFFYDKLTAREYVTFVANMYGISESDRTQRLSALAERFAIAHRLDELVESYSHGMRQKLAFCATFVHAPKLVMIDEPWVGLDPRAIRSLIEFLREQCASGTTLVVSTHTLALAQEISSRVAIIDHGKIIANGTIEELLESPEYHSLEDLFLSLTED